MNLIHASLDQLAAAHGRVALPVAVTADTVPDAARLLGRAAVDREVGMSIGGRPTTGAVLRVRSMRGRTIATDWYLTVARPAAAAATLAMEVAVASGSVRIDADRAVFDSPSTGRLALAVAATHRRASPGTIGSDLFVSIGDGRVAVTARVRSHHHAAEAWGLLAAALDAAIGALDGRPPAAGELGRPSDAPLHLVWSRLDATRSRAGLVLGVAGLVAVAAASLVPAVTGPHDVVAEIIAHRTAAGPAVPAVALPVAGAAVSLVVAGLVRGVVKRGRVGVALALAVVLVLLGWQRHHAAGSVVEDGRALERLRVDCPTLVQDANGTVICSDGSAPTTLAPVARTAAPATMITAGAIASVGLGLGLARGRVHRLAATSTGTPTEVR